MIEKLLGIGVKKEKILHMAESMFHDHKPANDHGLQSCWVYRRHAQQGFGAINAPLLSRRRGIVKSANQEAGNSLSVALSKCLSAPCAFARCPTNSPESL